MKFFLFLFLLINITGCDCFMTDNAACNMEHCKKNSDCSQENYYCNNTGLCLESPCEDNTILCYDGKCKVKDKLVNTDMSGAEVFYCACNDGAITVEDGTCRYPCKSTDDCVRGTCGSSSGYCTSYDYKARCHDDSWCKIGLFCKLADNGWKYCDYP